MEDNRKREIQLEYTIIAGVNGSGKSTIYHSGILDSQNMGIRINVDELIQKEYQNKWNDKMIQMEAGLRIVKQINDCLDNGKSFNQETTLSGGTTFYTIKRAKEKGFKISLYYIGLENVELSIQRVRERVDKGGHGIDRETLLNRYRISLNNLKEAVRLCDNVVIYDNSRNFEKTLDVRDNTLRYCAKVIPDYYKEILTPYIQEKKKETFLKDLKENGFQNTDNIQKNYDKLSRRNVATLNEIHDICKGLIEVSAETKEIADKIGKELKGQEIQNQKNMMPEVF